MSILTPASSWIRSVRKCPRPPPRGASEQMATLPQRRPGWRKKPKAKVGKDATEKEEEYLERFLHAPRIPVCSGKTAYIRKSYHERIQRIVQVIGKNGLTLSVYVDRVLEQHFREYEEVIRRLYKKNYEDIY